MSGSGERRGGRGGGRERRGYVGDCQTLSLVMALLSYE
jgi:hypothetical protein